MNSTLVKIAVFLVFIATLFYVLKSKNEVSTVTEPWTREGRGDTVATDNRKIDDVASDVKTEDETSLFDTHKGADNSTEVEEEEEEESTVPTKVTGNVSLEKYIPSSSTNKEIVRHKAFILSYQEEYELASWVLHYLSSGAASGTADRSNTFLEDPLVETGSAVTQDYARSGYDRGHLCPAGDFKNDQELQNETFYMSNMSPQAPDFNRGIWSDLELRVRHWAETRGGLVVVTGPILKAGLSYIGKRNQIAVPESFYKIVYDPKTNQAIAFLIPNEGSVELVKSFAVPIDKVEKLTGINFFAQLPDAVEQKIETSVRLDDWF